MLLRRLSRHWLASSSFKEWALSSAATAASPACDDRFDPPLLDVHSCQADPRQILAGAEDGNGCYLPAVLRKVSLTLLLVAAVLFAPEAKWIGVPGEGGLGKNDKRGPSVYRTSAPFRIGNRGLSDCPT